MIPHPFPNQPGLGPHPPPGPLMMPPQPYYDGSGYCPPGYMGPAPPIMQGGGPMGTYLPPPLVGPQKPPLIEQINQDHTPNVQYQVLNNVCVVVYMYMFFSVHKLHVCYVCAFGIL